MKESKNNVLDFEVPILEYESADEADKAAGRAGATLAVAHKYMKYHETFDDARDLIEEIVQEKTGVPFLTIPVLGEGGVQEKDDKGAPLFERDYNKDSAAKYVKRALALKPDVTRAVIQSLIDQRARGYTYQDNGVPVVVPPLAVDITERVRTPRKPPVLSKDDKAAAAGILAAGNVDLFNQALVEFNMEVFQPTGDADKDTLALGWKCRDWRLEDARRTQAAKMAKFTTAKAPTKATAKK